MAVASVWDPWSPTSWSGCSLHLLRSLVDDYGATPIALGPTAIPTSLKTRILAHLSNQRGQIYVSELTEPTLRYFAARTAEKLNQIECDCVLAFGAHTTAFLETDLPIYQFWDCTFEGNLEYPWFAKLASPCIRTGHLMERKSLQTAAMSFYSSEWAIDSAVQTYGADPSRIKLVPLAANIDCNRSTEDVERLIAKRSNTVIELLFLGVDWVRKGGDLALAVAHELNSRGMPTILHVVGCAPNLRGEMPDFVRPHGFLDKDTPAELAKLQSLIGMSHFLLVPSLAEAFGAVYAEASSFGTPSLARRLGGVDSVITEGVNGYLFDRQAPPAAYCETIERLWNNPEKYRALARSSFRHFTEQLTWKYSAGKLLGYINDDLNSRADRRQIS